MKVEEKLTTLGLELPSLETSTTRTRPGAHYISHFPVQEPALPVRHGRRARTARDIWAGAVGKDLTLEQDASRALRGDHDAGGR